MVAVTEASPQAKMLAQQIHDLGRGFSHTDFLGAIAIAIAVYIVATAKPGAQDEVVELVCAGIRMQMKQIREMME